jgi:serine/threonine-protein kinase
VPTQFGKYLLLRKLAEGGMAELFLARQAGMEGFEKLVVVKRILPQLMSEPEFVKMFLNEARLAARLNHPNIVQIFELGQIDKLYFIAMEFIHGEDLRSLVVEANKITLKPTPGLVCRILADTLAGLHYAHTRVSPDGKPLGLVHRDVSPQNVLVTYEGSVKLVDFGIAKATRATSEQTQAGLFKGKFSYMAPEQTRGQSLDARADVFAVGILLWELLTWRRLFKRATEMATLIAVAEDAIPSPRALVRELPAELERISLKALARPIEERYATAQEMRADLEALIRKEGWEADALTVGRFMSQCFADKLKAQDADVRAAGLASLDDFLLTVQESTRISWMNDVKPQATPSAGLPTAPNVLPDVLYDEAAMTKPTEVAPPEDMRARAAASLAAPPGSGLPPRTPPPPPRPSHASGSVGSAPKPIATAPPAARTMDPVTTPHRAPQAPLAPPPAMAPPPRTNASLAGEWAESNLPPTVATPPPAGYSSDWAPNSAPTVAASSSTTAKREAYDPPPSRWKRVVVIGSAATVVAGIALTAALWSPSEATPPGPTPDHPGKKDDPPHDTPPGAAVATLVITTDAPAVISVDGISEPLGTTATVKVKPGVDHVVKVQRPGHEVHTVHVPAPAANEQLPINVKVR